MKVSNIKKELKKVAGEPQGMTKDQRETAICKIVEYKVPLQTRGTFWEFVKEQICFINKMVFLWHGVWLMIFLSAMKNKSLAVIDGSGVCLLSLAPPILILCTTNEIAKIYCHGLIEIEYTTKYCLSKVILLRLLLISLTTGGLLIISCIPAKYFLGIHYGKALVYTLTPMLCMSGCLIKFMERIHGQQLNYIVFAVYVGATVFIFFGSGIFFQIFTEDLFEIWSLVFISALGANVFSAYRLSKKLAQYEFLMEKAG